MRFRLDTEAKRLEYRRSFAVPGALVVRPKGCAEGTEVYAYERNGRVSAVGFRGTAGKPDFNYSFRTPEQREKHVREWAERLRRHEEAKRKTREAARGYRHTYEVGTLLYTSWGYDQTNIDYFQVISRTDATITIRGVAAETVDTPAWCQSLVRPVAGKFFGPPHTCRVYAPTGSGEGHVSYDGHALHRYTSGTTQRATSYA